MPSEVGAGIQNWPRPRPGESKLAHLPVGLQLRDALITRLADGARVLPVSHTRRTALYRHRRPVIEAE
jgi:hypothetical protein